MDEILERMCYSYMEVPWHKIGTVSETPMFAEQILIGPMKGGPSYEKRDNYCRFENPDGTVEWRSTGEQTIWRTPYGEENQPTPLGAYTDVLNVIQPLEVAQAFDANVRQPVETMAFLRKGREMFITWTLPTIAIRGVDEVKMYGLLRVGFDGTLGASILNTTVRTVCWNTLVMSMAWAKANDGYVWTGKKSSDTLIADMAIWLEHVQTRAVQSARLTEDFFRALAGVPVNDDSTVHEILHEAFPVSQPVPDDYPNRLRSRAQERIDALNASRAETRDGIYALWAGQGTDITRDLWGVLNSTTEYFCHFQPSKRPVAESILFGPRNDAMVRVANILRERI